MDPLPPSKSLPYLISLVSSLVGALVMYWTVADRMEKQITEKVNLVSRVSDLGAQINAVSKEVDNLRSDMAALRNQANQTNQAK